MVLLCLTLPGLSSMVLGLFGRFIGNYGVKNISILLMLMSSILGMINFVDMMMNKNMVMMEMLNWFEIGVLNDKIIINMDKLCSSMLVLVSLVSLNVHMFSCSYMKYDPHLPSFLSYLSLFTLFMNMLISSSNFVQLFMGWEGVGLCSYLLMNFWFTSMKANKSAIKAMMINKMGDLGLLLSFMMMWLMIGSLDFSEISICLIQVKSIELMNLSGLLLILAVVGKSSQMGLHMWLPDAMEGPTPVSALIHAATMVTAGVFLLIKMSPFLEILSLILLVIMLIGSLTCFFSATMGIVQNDLKKVMAYSTCSQLGYMVLICGFSFYDCSLFHLINHGFFKALLFLSAGSMIHALTDDQDISKMGSIKNITPLSYIFMMMGSMSLMGLPFLSGYYSKDLIMELINNSNKIYYSFILGVISAGLTSFYSVSLIYMVFMNTPGISKTNFEVSRESDILITGSLGFLFILSIVVGYSFQYLIMEDMNPIPINNLNKSNPLMISMMGIGIGLWMGLNIKNLWNFKMQYFQNLYYFLTLSWYFDFLFNKYMSLNFMKMGYIINYKLIDNQMLEYVGPYFFFKAIVNKSGMTSLFHSGSLYSYMYFFFVFILVMTLNLSFLLILKNLSYLTCLYMLVGADKWVY